MIFIFWRIPKLMQCFFNHFTRSKVDFQVMVLVRHANVVQQALRASDNIEQRQAHV